MNCTYNKGSISSSCSAPPVGADTGFTGQGLAFSGIYNSTSVSGFTTSGNVVKGQLCMIDKISSNQLQQLPVCAITTLNLATNVTNSYWNYENASTSIGGIIGFGPGNIDYWQQVGKNWNQYQLGIKLNNMSDWTGFGVPKDQIITQSTSMLSIGSNIVSSGILTLGTLNFNTTLVGVKNTFAASNFGFG